MGGWGGGTLSVILHQPMWGEAEYAVDHHCGGRWQEREEGTDWWCDSVIGVTKVFMPEVKKPTLMVSCPLCPILHITLSKVSTGDTIFCPQSDDVPLPSGYYGDLSLSGPIHLIVYLKQLILLSLPTTSIYMSLCLHSYSIAII